MLTKNNTGQLQSRRKFINTGMQAAAGVALLTVPGTSQADSFFTSSRQYKVQEVIDIILKEIPKADLKNTVDTIKAGSKDALVTGIVTTMFSTVEVIRKAIGLKANFIIAHEPTFYNHADNMNLVKANEVQQKKLELLNDNNITVWRSHDTWHAIKPDGITYGVIKKMNWQSYHQSNSKLVNLPASSLKEIVKQFKQNLGINHLRVIGDLNQSCKKIALLPGAWGGREQISTIIEEKPDLLVVGELSEWETAEYVRDARLLGNNLSLVVLGHAFSEEPGMLWMAEWLQPKLAGITVTHVPSGEPFTWL